MKKSILLLLLALCSSGVFSQVQNIELVSRLDYASLLSNLWGYTAPDGTEYAIVGLRSGTSIVSLADPANPVEVAFIPGSESIWRELKTYGQFAYVVTDQPGTKDGLLVVDLSGLPGPVTWYNWTPFLPEFNDSLFTCHTIFVDESGYAYLNSCNVNSSGVIFLDLFSEPGVPKYAGKNYPVGTHDCYARNNLLYSAEIFNGNLAIYDVSDKANPLLLGTQPTPFKFTHNTWLSDDGKVVYTTDERPNAPVASFDVTDPTDIRLLDEFRPPATLGTGVICHNVHVLNDFLVIANYTDGCVVVDASRPDNLVQTGWYDTNMDFSQGFHGAWGAYPYFPSGHIIISDIENGLYVLKPTYLRACFLEGKITDALSGAGVFGATAKILSPEPNTASSDLVGKYRTGQATPGAFEVKFTAKGYFDLIANATISNGNVTLLDVQMTPLPRYELAGNVREFSTKKPIPDATVFVENQDFSYTAVTNSGGFFSIPEVVEGSYTVYAGKWGYRNDQRENVAANAGQIDFELGEGYEDNFNLDFGWSESGDATTGKWERGVPHETHDEFAVFNPGTDAPGDFGNRCYVTGNKGLLPSDDDVDKGATVLTSPPMQLRSRYNRPLLAFDYWYTVPFAGIPLNDSLSVFVTNGMQTVLLAVITESAQVWRSSDTFQLADYLELNDEVRIIFRITDYDPNYHFLEAGVDHFRVFDGLPDARLTIDEDGIKMSIFPNPFSQKLTVGYKVERSFTTLKLLVFNALGQIAVPEVTLSNAQGSVELTPDLPQGIYFVALQVDDKLGKAARVVKQ